MVALVRPILLKPKLLSKAELLKLVKLNEERRRNEDSSRENTR